MNREEVHAIWLEVKENSRKLAACPGPHEFPPLEATLGAYYVCAKCGGKLNASNRSWYDKGLEHGRKGTT